jgi:hypothetical protein
MSNIKPTKTEYKGIVFDSKSEAIFARAMDIQNAETERNSKMFWHYHPERFTMNDYCPDFSIQLWSKIYDGKKFDQLTQSVILIEYKPAAPTQTYVDKIRSYYDALKEKDHYNVIDYILICYGNVFESESLKVIQIYSDSSGNTISKDSSYITDNIFCKEYISEARNYRFDLGQNPT